MSSVANDINEIISQALSMYGEDITVPPETPNETEIITPNSNSVLVDESTSRFSSAIWYNKIQSLTVTLAGVGGIGSYISFLLSRLHPALINIYDDDTVELANLSGQLFSTTHIGMSKVDCCANVAEKFSQYYNIFTYKEKFTASSHPTDIMICGFDNMKARKDYFLAWKYHIKDYTEEGKKQCLFIDGRLAAENFQILCIQGNDERAKEKYEKEFLFTDAEADATICSYKQTTFMANMIGSYIVNLFVNFAANLCNPLIPRELPFFMEYTAETMYLKVIA